MNDWMNRLDVTASKGRGTKRRICDPNTITLSLSRP